jgi:pimeloyl-ACP methyl ester carboxylesterase
MAEADVRVIALIAKQPPSMAGRRICTTPSSEPAPSHQNSTLLLWATATASCQESYGRAYAASIPGALKVMTPAGHCPHLDQPDEFARRVHAFTEGRSS